MIVFIFIIKINIIKAFQFTANYKRINFSPMLKINNDYHSPIINQMIYHHL